MRIVAGKFKGHKLADFGKLETKSNLRPTTDRTRESLFNILTNGVLGDLVTDARVLDLFAGTGALSLEAISRGADSATLIDNGQLACQIIQKNLAKFGNPSNIFFKPLNALKLPLNQTPGFTLVFIDPPYGKNLCQVSLSSMQRFGWLASSAIILCEDIRILNKLFESIFNAGVEAADQIK